MLGFAYGCLFGLFPTITIEWFGLRTYSSMEHCLGIDLRVAHFSENWGFVSLAPMLGGNAFSIAFGRNLDAHAPSELDSPDASISRGLPVLSSLVLREATSDSSHQCLQGKECYAGSLLMTTTACCIALVLAVYAGWKDYKAGKGLVRTPRGHTPVVDTVWEDEEE